MRGINVSTLHYLVDTTVSHLFVANTALKSEQRRIDFEIGYRRDNAKIEETKKPAMAKCGAIFKA